MASPKNPRPQAQGKPQTGLPGSDNDPALDQQEAASEAENEAEGDGSAEDDVAYENEDDIELDQGNDALNDPVEGVIEEKPEAVKMGTEVPAIPAGHIAILSSPRNFGIHVTTWGPNAEGKRSIIANHLHHFKKGKTPLSKEQHDALSIDPYMQDNGAEILYRKAPDVKVKPKPSTNA